MQRREFLEFLTGLPVGALLADNASSADAPSAKVPLTGQPDADEQLFCRLGDPNQSRFTVIKAPMPITELLYLHPGEMTVVLGKQCNGKTSLALSIALEYAHWGREVWYFSMARRSREVADILGLELRHIDSFDGPDDERNRTRHFHGYLGDEQLSIRFFDHYFATNLSLPALALGLMASGIRTPELVIYDADSIDCTTRTDADEDSFARQLRQRRRECYSPLDAAMLVTLGMHDVDTAGRLDKRPRLTDLKSRPDPRPGESLADELFFVHRPSLYDELPTGYPDVLELTRCNRLRNEGFTRVLVRDQDTRRIRKVNHEEARQLVGWDPDDILSDSGDDV